MEAAKSQGGIFQATGGAALNDDDFIIAHERSLLKEQLEGLEKQKKQRLLDCQREKRAFEIIESEKSKGSYKSDELKDLIAWKTGRACPSKVSLLAKRQALWEVVKDDEVQPTVEWSMEDEQQLIDLQTKLESNLKLDETAFGRDRELETNKAKALLMSLPEDERVAVAASLASAGGSEHPTEDLTESRTDDRLHYESPSDSDSE